jgi:hypothetical protein
MNKKLAKKLAASAIVGVLAATSLSACSTKGTSAPTKAEKERSAYLGSNSCSGKTSCKGKAGCKGKASCKGKSKCGK